MKFHPKYLLFGAIFVALIVGYYYYLTNMNTKSVEDTNNLGEVQKVITENLANDRDDIVQYVVGSYEK